MTAVWEATLNTISSGSTKPKDFITRINDEVSHLIELTTGVPSKKARQLSAEHRTATIMSYMPI